MSNFIAIFLILFISHLVVLFVGYYFGTTFIENNYYEDYYDPDFGEHSTNSDDIINDKPTANS